jgi:hypothetical protein
VEQGDSVHAVQFRTGYKDVPTSPPAGGIAPGNSPYTYDADDASVGDLDGDGALDIVLKWQPTNAKDNSQPGYTGNTITDGIKLDGTRLWRIDLGRNIRSGAHYTQFQVYDYDGEGRAEVEMKTADGTKDGPRPGPPRTPPCARRPAPPSAGSRPASTSCPGGTATPSANSSTALASTSTARPVTPAC